VTHGNAASLARVIHDRSPVSQGVAASLAREVHSNFVMLFDLFANSVHWNSKSFDFHRYLFFASASLHFSQPGSKVVTERFLGVWLK